MSIADVIIDVIVIIRINEMPAKWYRKSCQIHSMENSSESSINKTGILLFLLTLHISRALLSLPIRTYSKMKALRSVSGLFLLAFNVIAARTEHS